MKEYSNKIVALFVLLVPCVLFAAERPWEVFIDPISGNECGIINAGNMELVQLTGSGVIVAVRGTDVILGDYEIDENGNVYYLDELMGFIAFAYDGDGMRTLWWVNTLGTNTYDLDLETGVPTLSDMGPTDYIDVGCDACSFWDDPSVCPEEEDGFYISHCVPLWLRSDASAFAFSGWIKLSENPKTKKTLKSQGASVPDYCKKGNRGRHRWVGEFRVLTGTNPRPCIMVIGGGTLHSLIVTSPVSGILLSGDMG